MLRFPGSNKFFVNLAHTTTATHLHVVTIHRVINGILLLRSFGRLFLKLCVFHVFIFNLSFPVSSSEVGISTGFPIFGLRFRLLVGCLRVSEPILSPHLDKLITHNKEVINSGAKLMDKNYYFQIYFKKILFQLTR